MEKLWTTSEVAQYLGVTEGDVEQLVKEGQLTGYKLGGQFLRFKPEQVEALKRTIRVRPEGKNVHKRPALPWWNQAQDFVYFHDFYIVSATLLALLVVYLIALG